MKYTEIAKKANGGCELIEGKNKANWDNYTGEILSINGIAPLGSGDKSFFAVTIAENNDIYFNSCGAINNVLGAILESEGGDLVTVNAVLSTEPLKIKVGEKTPCKNDPKKTFRNIEILE